ncbi:hypothetical protein [Bacillus atrophaeus]|nr:hypothetical protein [Bacillus atrophaeus]MCY8990125.1 hypothetical protein [Bacillus atrophaeus]
MKAKVAVFSVVLFHQKKVNRFASFKGKNLFFRQPKAAKLIIGFRW